MCCMDEKIEAVHSYLAAEFPGAEIYRTPPGQPKTKLEFHHDAVMFRIDTGSVLHRLYAHENFLSDNPPSTITDLVKRWEVASELRRSGKKPLLVGHEGLRLMEG